MTENDRSALVVGVTGSQGGATARHLLAAGWRVRGLTRNPGSRRARAVAASGVELVSGNLDDGEDLTEVVKGVDGVYGVTDFWRNGVEGEIRQGCRLAEAVARAGCPRFVFSSVNGARDGTGVPHVVSKGLIERRIEDLGIPATVLRPSIFMEDLVDPRYFPPAYWRMAPRIIGWEKPLPWIAVDDIGRVAAHILDNWRAWRGRVLELTGDRRSLGEARRLYREAFGKRPFRIPIPLWMFRRVVSDELVVMWQWQARSDFGSFSPELKKMPFDLMDMESWFRERARGPRGASLNSRQASGPRDQESE